MRRPLIAGNWKMNLSLTQIRDLIAQIRPAAESSPNVDVAVCPPYIYLFPTAKALEGSPISLGAQNLYHEAGGAFTGEISPSMVAETGARYVIVGHSERRHTIGHLEDDWMINHKLRAALVAGLTPILCVGEKLEERTAGRTFDVVRFQLTAGLLGVEKLDPGRIVVAYEPVWAIGTGHHATPDQAQEVHVDLRLTLSQIAGKDAATRIRILYGGSLTADNAAAIFKEPDVDGGLVGGASLKAEAFSAIIRAAAAARTGG